jgi:hypothetical protein
MISRALQIELKHHLALESELIAAGVLGPPPVTKPEPAKRMPGIKIYTTDWTLKIQRRDVPIIVKGRVPSNSDITHLRRRFW